MLLAAIAVVGPTGDPDVWWHLRAGQLALAGSDLANDVFSYSLSGQPWRYRDVLADVILFRGFASLGFRWFLVLKLLTAATEAAALCLFLPRRERTATVWLGGAALLLLTVPLVERPNLFTVALFPLLLALLDRLRTRIGARVLPLVPWVVVVSWKWIALHRAGLLAIGLVASLAVVTALARWRPSRALFGVRPSAAELGLVALTACAVAAVVPLLPFGLRGFTSSVAVVGSDQLHQQISEWRRLDPLALFRTFPLALSLAVLALVLVAAQLRAALRRDSEGPIVLWHALLLLGFCAAALDSVRWVPYLAAVAVLLIARSVAGPAQRLGQRPALRLLPVLVFVSSIAALSWARVSPFRLGEDRTRLPVDAAEFLDRAQLGGRIANAFDEGGYLIWRLWPRAQVLVDGRNETVYPAAFLARASAAEHDRAVFEAMRQEDGATLVVAGNFPGRLTHGFLAEDPSWALVSWSDAALVYARRAAHPELEDQRFRYIDPRAIDRSVVRVIGEHDRAAVAALGEELRRMIAVSPESVRALVGLALYQHLVGSGPARDEVLHRLEGIAPDHPAVRELRRRLRP